MYEYTKIKDRYLSFQLPNCAYKEITHRLQGAIIFIQEEINKSFIIIKIYTEKNGYEKIISNVELELIYNNEIPNMDTYTLKFNGLPTSK